MSCWPTAPVALPPVSAKLAADMVAGLGVIKLLAGSKGRGGRAIAGVSELAVEPGEHIEALDVNPLI